MTLAACAPTAHRSIGYGLPVSPTSTLRRCVRCGASWHAWSDTEPPRACPCCRDQRRAANQRTRDAALRVPDVSRDAGAAEIRWALEEWGKRIRDAGWPVTRDEAERAIRLWLKGMTGT